jgi:hypothetical protein
MDPRDFLLPRPPLDLPLEKRKAFDDVWQLRSEADFIDYRLPFPKWEFLSYVCQTREVVLHGSQKKGIDTVAPRQANDIRAFSNRQAIYATTDGIWVIYFAIIDRGRYAKLSLFNSCLQVRSSTGELSDPLYFFSVTNSALVQKPWCEGAVYILPRRSFEREASQQIQGMEIVFPHWISTSSAYPLGKLRVGPDDFPFLSQIHGHDDEKLVKLATAHPDGFPWPEALES